MAEERSSAFVSDLTVPAQSAVLVVLPRLFALLAEK